MNIAHGLPQFPRQFAGEPMPSFRLFKNLALGCFGCPKISGPPLRNRTAGHKADRTGPRPQRLPAAAVGSLLEEKRWTAPVAELHDLGHILHPCWMVLCATCANVLSHFFSCCQLLSTFISSYLPFTLPKL